MTSAGILDGGTAVAGLADHDLVAAAAAVIARPKAVPTDSFLLHAPLELLARAVLLARCSPGAREAARGRIVALARAHADAGPDLELDPNDVGERDDGAATVERLAGALAAGDEVGAALAGRRLGATTSPEHLTALVGDALVDRLAAAGHAPIFLATLTRTGARSPAVGAMLGTLARELAGGATTDPAMRLSWFDGPDRPTPHGADRPAGPAGASGLGARVAATPALGVPGSTFIAPVMQQAEADGFARGVVGDALDDPEGPVALVRVATRSMLLDDPDHAPYGWTHCLTMPLAVLTIAPLLQDPRRALAVAATHVVGFRAALGTGPLDPGPTFAAPDRDRLQATIDRAAAHHDAHLAKYVVACLEAAAIDPAGAGQHLAAAVALDDWWARAEPVS